jgi:signal transduction histidine kinase
LNIALPAKARVLLADDHLALLESVSRLLAATFDIVAVASDGRQALDLARRLRPDVVVLDIAMPELDGFQTLEQLRRDGAETRVVFLTMHRDDEFVSAAINAGARGYVLKSRIHLDLISAIDHVLAGRLFVPSPTSLSLSSVNGRLIEAQEAERARIARDLHDDIGQRLALLALALQQVKDLLPDSSGGEAAASLDALQKQTAEIIGDVQTLSHELHPPRLLHVGVVPAMRSFCGELSGQKSAEIDFRYEDVPVGVPPDVSLCLFRVLQEALHNAVRHSGARHFDVHLRGTGDAIDLTIRDEGVGFDVDAANRGLGLGLTSMKERLKLVGGELFIESRSTRGTTVLARVPVRPG